MDVPLITIFASFIFIFAVESHSIDNYFDVLFNKFSSEGHLSQDQPVNMKLCFVSGEKRVLQNKKNDILYKQDVLRMIDNMIIG
jgi:hypothetical protein